MSGGSSLEISKCRLFLTSDVQGHCRNCIVWFAVCHGLLLKSVTIKNFFMHLWTDIMSQHLFPSTVSFSLNKKNWSAGPNSPFFSYNGVSWIACGCIPQMRQFYLLTPPESVKWASSVIKICSQKSGSASIIRATVWPYFKRRGRSVK